MARQAIIVAGALGDRPIYIGPFPNADAAADYIEHTGVYMPRIAEIVVPFAQEGEVAA